MRVDQAAALDLGYRHSVFQSNGEAICEVTLSLQRGKREAIEEKISLSERFGLWLSFYPFDQEAYLDIVAHWLRSFGCGDAEIARAERDALNWALQRGSRSGRVAWQFAKDWAGAHSTQRARRGRGK